MPADDTARGAEPKARSRFDDITKLVAVVSTVVTVVLAVAGYLSNQKVQSLQKAVQDLDLAKKNYDLSARVIVDYSAPLARSFALQYATNEENKVKYRTAIMFPTPQIAAELSPLIEQWRLRRGLMTGEACKQEGLKARQIVLLKLKNLGNAMADDVVLKARASPRAGNAAARWNVSLANGEAVPYADLVGRIDDWSPVDIPIGRLYGGDTKDEERISNQVVLASVSGSADLYGSALVPIELTWTDSISGQRRSMKLDPAMLRNDLLGAEIGSLGTARKAC